MKKETPKETIKETIKATLKVLSREYTANGKTVEETLLKLQPPAVRTLGILTLEKGKLKREKIIQPRLVFGCWGKQSQTTKNVAMKNIKILFSDF